MSALTDSLTTTLSNVVTMYFQAHGYHWNVEGSDFRQYHDLFAEIYEDVYGSIDPIAENIRKLDEYAPLQLQDFIKNRDVEPSAVKPAPKPMVKELLKVNDGVIKSLNAAFKDAVDADEQGIANFLSERIDQHQKWHWFLTASSN